MLYLFNIMCNNRLIKEVALKKTLTGEG